MYMHRDAECQRIYTSFMGDNGWNRLIDSNLSAAFGDEVSPIYPTITL